MQKEQEEIYQYLLTAVKFIREKEGKLIDKKLLAKQLGIPFVALDELCVTLFGVSFEDFYPLVCDAHIKRRLRKAPSSLFDVLPVETISSGGVSDSHLVQLVPMVWEEHQEVNAKVAIHYSIFFTPLGKVLLASTAVGICYAVFVTDTDAAIEDLLATFPGAIFYEKCEAIHEVALSFFYWGSSPREPLTLHVKGTPFQLRVWQNLLTIPKGHLTTYADVAFAIGQPKASRAVGTAIGQNNIAFLIPCHRIVQTSGKLGGYRWGLSQKALLIGWEQLNP